jgi:hypothetical protein
LREVRKGNAHVVTRRIRYKTCGIAYCVVAIVFLVICGLIVIVADTIVDAL